MAKTIIIKDDKSDKWDKCDKCKYKCKCRHMGGMGYGLGFIGAAVYFVSSAVGFWAVVLAILKALVWPAFVVYGLMKFLGM